MYSQRKSIPQFFDVLTNDFYLLMESSAPVRQTVTLFDRSTIALSGTQTVYTYTMPSAIFPVSSVKITMNGSQVAIPGTSSADEFASMLQSVTNVEFIHSRDVVNEYYSSKGAGSNTFGNIIVGFTPYTPDVGNYAGGTQISITLVSAITYNQFVAALPSLKSYFFNDIGIYADSSSQLQQPIMITKFKDQFGELLTTKFSPEMNKFQRIFAYDPYPIFFPVDGNNTFTYSINAGERVYWRLGTKCFDTNQAVGLPPSKSQYSPVENYEPIIGLAPRIVNEVKALKL